MDYKKLFEYQVIGSELVKIERELGNSDEKKRAASLDNMWKKAVEENNRRNADADELMANFEKTEASLSATESSMKEISDAFKGVDDLTEIEYYEKKLAALSEELMRYERDLRKMTGSIDGLLNSDDKVIKQAAQIKSNYNDAMRSYQILKNKLQEAGTPISAKLRALEKDIPEEYLAIYKRCKAANKLPAFVKYDNDGSCLCGINLPNNVMAKLKEVGDHAECPTCGRMIIKVNV